MEVMAHTLPKLVGINHVALEVGDIEEALAFYGRIFDFILRGRGEGQAFIDMGDQFLALMQEENLGSDRKRHFGLVVDSRSRVRDLAAAAGAKLLEGPFLDFLDPWGNRIEIVEYADIQFMKADRVLAKLDISAGKTEKARRDIAEKFGE
jgi:catechol-2,3-dioxygenase